MFPCLVKESIENSFIKVKAAQIFDAESLWSPPQKIWYFHTDSKFFVLQFRPFRPEWRGDAEAYLSHTKIKGW